ncbi:astacin [Oesophagostomum dentatum]|uniref:Metalloendopeptidase n=1 Tax=Oesophagostomum dentatum TaxID=61180 RepID=A0A0B1SS56_OESDE|nr:astacin [Oesophagostomum dentatum]
MVGGEQSLSLRNGCDVVGLAAHEFTHTLGVYHMQMRDDRDDYLTIDLTNVPAGMQGNFAKLSTDESINYNPYEYGSVMHYGSNT